MNEQEMLEINRMGWNEVAEQFFEGSFTDLQYGIYGPFESEMGLLGDLKGQTILEIGCGSGHTLEYLATQGAKELYGVDLSAKQIALAKETVARFNLPIHFTETAMEEMRDIPHAHFDLAISMYALGWTVNLQKTLHHIFSALKQGGVFVFTWEHPIHSLVTYVDGKMVLRLPYSRDQYERHDTWRKVPIVMNYRRMSTYLNTLIQCGFVIDHVVEETRIPEDDNSQPEQWYSADKARMLPPSFTIRCHKP